jgi:ribosome-binding protein aMBF1 (putative translation factor)
LKMTAKTCAACDCQLDGSSFKVEIGGKQVEVCCDDCAKTLKEAYAATRAKTAGKRR